jgi:hypothetical protein
MPETLAEEHKNENRIVSAWLLYYHDRKKDYERRREVILQSSSASRISEAPGHASVSDTTGRKGDKLAELAEDAGAWLALIAEVEERLPWKMQIFLRLRREFRYARSRGRGRPAWIPHVQRHYAEEVAAVLKRSEEDVWVSRVETFGDWWKMIIEYTGRLAGKRGLLP